MPTREPTDGSITVNECQDGRIFIRIGEETITIGKFNAVRLAAILCAKFNMNLPKEIAKKLVF